MYVFNNVQDSWANHTQKSRKKDHAKMEAKRPFKQINKEFNFDQHAK